MSAAATHACAGKPGETFFASLEKELLRRERSTIRERARIRTFWYIECLYNTRRRLHEA
jgi:hypothetical protein